MPRCGRHHRPTVEPWGPRPPAWAAAPWERPRMPRLAVLLRAPRKRQGTHRCSRREAQGEVWRLLRALRSKGDENQSESVL